MEVKKKRKLYRRAAKVAGWRVVNRFGRAVPYVGTVIAVGLVGHSIKKKGVVKGAINSTLDAIPVVGTAKNAIEFFTGDLLKDKQRRPAKIEKNKRHGELSSK
ncbi:MAG: hypothetical protein ACK5NT_15745 [Pyrinomonadaceae bacterium]